MRGEWGEKMLKANFLLSQYILFCTTHNNIFYSSQQTTGKEYILFFTTDNRERISEKEYQRKNIRKRISVFLKHFKI